MDGHIRMKKRRQSTSEKLGVALVVLLIVGAASLVTQKIQSDGVAPLPTANRSAEVADVLPLIDLLPDGEHGWVGQVTPGWSGGSDPGALEAVCERALARLGAQPDQTLTLVGEDGGPAIECGAGLTPGGPRVAQMPGAVPGATVPASGAASTSGSSAGAPAAGPVPGAPPAGPVPGAASPAAPSGGLPAR